MPELPEVETVRQGLADHVLGRRVAAVHVGSPRAVRRLPGGGAQLTEGLLHTTPRAAVRRGKFAWLLLDDDAAPDDAPLTSSSLTRPRALLVHLGMSGQLLVRERASLGEDDHPHLRVRLAFDDGGALDFVDQRTFGYVSVEPLVATPDGLPGGHGAPDAVLPEPAAHIARDLLDPALDLDALGRALRRRRTAVKRALLDQTFVSGVGNIYADEALWRAQVHPERAADRLTAAQARAVLLAAREVMAAALVEGGTSFDRLYVNVNGASGYFDRSLAVYGREGEPCARCGTAVVRLAFANRSSHVCPRCQPAPRVPRRTGNLQG